jgi:Protein of unknown function (DUF3237)
LTADEFTPPQPQLEFMARFNVELADSWELGTTSDLGVRRIFPIIGGHFEGPLLNGEILNNGADWQIVTRDGCAIIDTRYLLRLDDASLAYLQTKGFRHGPPEVLARLAEGAAVDPREYYFRIHMTIETASARYNWLNRTVAIGSALRLAATVVYDAYMIR